MADEQDVAAVNQLHETYNQLRQQLGKVVVGQQEVIEQLLIALFAGGAVGYTLAISGATCGASVACFSGAGFVFAVALKALLATRTCLVVATWFTAFVVDTDAAARAVHIDFTGQVT